MIAQRDLTAVLQDKMRLKLAPPTAAAAAGRSPGWKHDGLRCSDHAQTEASRGAGRTDGRTHSARSSSGWR